MHELSGAAKPIVSEDKLDINERFYAHYTKYVEGATFRRGDNAWYMYTKRTFVPPTTNAQIAGPYNQNVKWGCYEHVSVCLAGDSDYAFKKHDYTYDNGVMVGDAFSELTDVWTFGMHNVENGYGYLPEETFNRVFRNGYETCCILPVRGADTTQEYNFEVVKLDNTSTTLNRDVKFVHVAYGAVNVNGTGYNQKQNILNLPNGTAIGSSTTSILIYGYLK